MFGRLPASLATLNRDAVGDGPGTDARTTKVDADQAGIGEAVGEGNATSDAMPMPEPSRQVLPIGQDGGVADTDRAIVPLLAIPPVIVL